MVSPLIGAGLNVASGLIGSLTGGAHRQYKYQKKLMALQNQYNVQNATTAYDRSRQLTLDSAMLDKLGKQQAGINPAFGQNGNVANAASAPQADGVSVPSPPDVSASSSALSIGINNAVQNLIGVATAKANIRKLTSEAEGNEIDNLTRNIRNLKEIGLKDSQIRNNFADLAYQNIVNKYADDRLSAEADSANSQAIINQADSSVRAAMNKADYDLKIQEIFNKVQTGILTQRQALTEFKKLSLMDSEIEKNRASAGLDSANTEGVRIDNEIKRDTKEDAKDMFRSNAVKAWYDSLPSDMQQVIYSSKPVQSAVHKLQRGNDLSSDDFAALGAAMGYENAGKLVGSLLQALSIKKRPSQSVSVYGRVNVRKK